MRIHGFDKTSIRNKILNVVISALLILTLIMGTISIMMVNRLAKNNSEQIMTEICDAETLRVDNRLDIVQYSVDLINEYALKLLEHKKREYVCSKEFKKQMSDMSIMVASQTDGARSVYVRFSPEITGDGTSGFFYTKEFGSDRFKIEKITDILAYNSTDVERVGWYYVPKAKGKPIWMTPYYNKNIDMFMISYVIPFYLESGEFAGVIGMDIDFNAIITEADEIKLYDTGHVALVDLSERIMYLTGKDGTTQSEKISNQLYNHITTINKKNTALEITDNRGTVSVICCNKLSNGMMIYVNVPKKEINDVRDRLLWITILVFTMVLLASILTIWKRTAKIINPLKKLTKIANGYAEGDWSESYICNTNDELQILSEAVSQMAKNTQDYITRINGLARTDAMTGLKNKTSYIEAVEAVKNNRHEEYNKYALVVMDINLLKKVNDSYGHEVGDILIKEAGRYICKIFKFSPIFRIGGDEFVAILNNEDYENRNESIKAFNDGLGYEVPEGKGIKLFISVGMANFNEDATEYDELFKIADQRMYERKKQMKMMRED